MNFTQEEIDWLELAIADNNKYRISVDNDCVCVDKYENDSEYECVFTFDNYGQDLIVQLLNYIGCNANCV